MRMAICLQIPTMEKYCQLQNVHGVNDVRQTEMLTVQPLYYLNLVLSKLKLLLRRSKVITHQVLIKF